jgi:hypothetical protein
MNKLKGHEWGFSCLQNPLSSCMDMVKDLLVCYILTWMPYIDMIEDLGACKILTWSYYVDMNEGSAVSKFTSLHGNETNVSWFCLLPRSLGLMSSKQFGIHTLSVVVNFTIVCKLYSEPSCNKLLFVDVMTVVKTAMYKVVINVLCLQKPTQLWQQYQLPLPLVSTIFYYCFALMLMVTVLLMLNCTVRSSHTIESMNTEHFCFALLTHSLPAI